MNPKICQTLKTLCVASVLALLAGCGSSKTNDPFVPTRVIGLGDAYNDTRTATTANGGLAATVREGTGTRSSVVEQVAAFFGTSNVVSYAGDGQKVADLPAQIAKAGSFTSSDLVVITIGTLDVKSGTDTTVAVQSLVSSVQAIKAAGASHILIMPVLDVSRTPWGRANSFDTGATERFNLAALSALSSAFGGQSPNTVIHANASGVTSSFLFATSLTSYSPFTDTGYNGTAAGTLPACGDATQFAGCDAANANASYTSMLFADGLHLTPVGNRWVAQFLYNATAFGWR